MPFVVLLLIVLPCWDSGTAVAVGQWARRRFGLSHIAGILDVCIGVVLILLPLLVGRVVALADGPPSRCRFCDRIWSRAEFPAWSAGSARCCQRVRAVGRRAAVHIRGAACGWNVGAAIRFIRVHPWP